MALPGQASNPNPADTATGESVFDQTLSWDAGTDATSHDVYFGTVSGNPSFQGNQTELAFSLEELLPSTTYYWRIDSVNLDGTTTGVQWSFTTAAAPSKATTPTPADEAEGVALSQVLSWVAGGGGGPVDDYRVYLGTTPQLGAEDFRGQQVGLSFDPDLDYLTRYYWRIDAVGPGGIAYGDVWSFSTTYPTSQFAYSGIGGDGAYGLRGGDLVILFGDFADHEGEDFEVYVHQGTDLDGARGLSGVPGSAELVKAKRDRIEFYLPPLAATGTYSVTCLRADKAAIFLGANCLVVLDDQYTSGVFKLRRMFPPWAATGPRKVSLLNAVSFSPPSPPAAPTVDSPIADGATTVTGTSPGYTLVTVRVYVDGVLRGTTLCTSDAWSVAVPQLSTGEEVTATLTNFIGEGPASSGVTVS